MSETTTQATSPRGAERRMTNLGASGGLERRTLADRRAENNHLYVHFRVGKVGFLLGIQQVQEVLMAQETTHVPLSTSMITGLINLRGQIVPAIDLRVALGQPPGDPASLVPYGHRATAMNVVVRSDEGAFSILADDVYDVVEASPPLLTPPPANLTGPLRSLATHVCKQPGRLLLVMDVRGVQRLIEGAVATAGRS